VSFKEVTMGQVAHIRYDGGALLLPAQDPYDREVVFEEAEFCARRHGSVGVQLGRKEMRISLSAADARAACAQCRRPVGVTSFVIDRQRVCANCARRWMGCTSRTRS
jgi:hypothetical protein